MQAAQVRAGEWQGRGTHAHMAAGASVRVQAPFLLVTKKKKQKKKQKKKKNKRKKVI